MPLFLSSSFIPSFLVWKPKSIQTQSSTQPKTKSTKGPLNRKRNPKGPTQRTSPCDYQYSPLVVGAQLEHLDLLGTDPNRSGRPQFLVIRAGSPFTDVQYLFFFYRLATEAMASKLSASCLVCIWVPNSFPQHFLIYFPRPLAWG